MTLKEFDQRLDEILLRLQIGTFKGDDIDLIDANRALRQLFKDVIDTKNKESIRLTAPGCENALRAALREIVEGDK